MRVNSTILMMNLRCEMTFLVLNRYELVRVFLIDKYVFAFSLSNKIMKSTKCDLPEKGNRL